MFYLNTTAPYEAFKMVVNDTIYVDKTLLIEPLTQRIGVEKRFFCVTKPRRFGKSINATMLAAFYSKGVESSSLFADKKIANRADCMTHLNQHNVIYISMNQLPDECSNYNDYIYDIRENIKEDIYEVYPELSKKRFSSISKLLAQTGDKFIFILDEWDSIFYKKFMTADDKESYLRFLEGLLKGQPYVELTYMTGVLPIAKYSSGSAMNMFDEYSFLADDLFDHYFGFTESEVLELCKEYSQPTFEEIKYWYDGYYTLDGEALFNPRSVNSALTRKRCRNYWTETGPMKEIEDCIRNNVDAVREDIVQFVAGNSIEIKLDGYSANDQRLETRNEILSAMVVFGFLSYHDQMLRIPNHELMEKFQRVLSIKGMGKVKQIVDRSEEMLRATIDGEAEKVASILEDIHDAEIPFIKYNDENSLSCVVTLAYLAARDYYTVTREEKRGKGYCDYLFIPNRKSRAAIILELKYGKSAEEALEQIKNKNYVQRLEDYPEILLVGINYNKDGDKHHECVIERLEK